MNIVLDELLSLGPSALEKLEINSRQGMMQPGDELAPYRFKSYCDAIHYTVGQCTLYRTRMFIQDGSYVRQVWHINLIKQIFNGLADEIS